MPVILIHILFFSVTFFNLHATTAQEKEFKIYDFGIAMTGEPAQNSKETYMSYATPQAKNGGHLKQSEIGTFDTINPYAIKGKAATGLNLIYDRLMARSWDEPFTLYPLIAEKIEVPEDRSAIIIHINPKAKFNDGSKITADDLIFSFNTLKEKGRPNMRSVYRQVSHIEKLDENSVKMSFGNDYNRETVMIVAMMPVLSKSWWENRNFEETLLEMPNSSGPYIISQIDPGTKITYKRNPNYWAAEEFANKGQNHFDLVSYEYYRDDTSALESFLKGNLNLRRENDPRKWAEQYNSPTIEKLEFMHGRPQAAEALIFNLRHPMFSDLKVRQALYLAFDGDWIKKNFFEDQLQRTNSYFANSVLSADREIFQDHVERRARLREAQNLLKEAGWNVQNNQLVKNGKPFKFEILINQPKYEKIILTFIQSLKRLGITANVRTLDSATFQNRLLDYNYDMILHKWQNSLSPGTEQMIYWSCSAAKEKGRFNYAGICQSEIDSAAEGISNAKTYEDLTKQVKELDGLLIDSFISIPLFFNNKDYIAVQKGMLLPPEITPLYGPVLETWAVSNPME